MKTKVWAQKAKRMQLAKSELLLILAVKTLEWRREVTDTPGCGTLPFDEWPSDHPLRRIALAYRLTGKDLGKLLDGIGDELERRAERAGYGDALGVFADDDWIEPPG